MAGLKLRLLPRSLFGRSLIILAMPILILQMVVAFIFYDRHWDSTANKLVYALTSEIKVISDDLKTADTAEKKKLIAQSWKSFDLILTVEPLDRTALKRYKGRLGRFYWLTLGDKLHADLEKKLSTPFAIQPHNNEKMFDVIVQLDGKTMARFVCPERRLTSSTTYIFILWVIGSAAILFGISILFMRNQIRPIMRLAVAAEKFGKGQDVPEFKPAGAAEVRQASRAFLEMKDRLKRQIEQRTMMLSGVSHDLRTPLTRMKLQLAMSKNDAAAENLRHDVEEMEQMIDGYLTFARGEGNEAVETTDLKTVIERVAANAGRQGYNVETFIAAALPLKLRPRAIERAIGNIVTNACKYGKNIAITAWQENGATAIRIDDDGPGIPLDAREQVFRPFYRIEKSRNKSTGGIGLGLSIAQDIVHGHGGEIMLGDSNMGGLSALILLPQ